MIWIGLLSLCDKGLDIVVDACELGETGSVQANRALKSEVHILGTLYKILIVEESDYRYSKEADGWCDTSVKELLVFNFKQSVESVRDLVEYQRKVIRHEIMMRLYLALSIRLWQISRIKSVQLLQFL